jgi:2-C-methyl-D-erythritol 4-phosphate cytidylyltransferase/2-C-methyl-D-erythritol 2,4-cyclodiphosphate synthase
VDLTIISESVRIGPFREAIRAGIAGAIGLDTERVSVKATSTDGIGSIGRDEGLAAMAVVTAVLAS